MITMDDIIRDEHPTLRTVAEEVSFPLDDQYKKLASDMIEFLKNSQDEEIAKKYDLVEGVYVVSVEEFSAAEKAGIKPQDVIIGINGKTIKTMDELNAVKNTHNIGDQMTIVVNRNGEEKELTLTLQEQ